MRKHLLIFAVFLGMAVFVFFQARELLLVYYLLSPLWLFPLFYFLKEKIYLLFVLCLAGMVLIHGWFLFQHPQPRMFMLLMVQGALFFAFCTYFWELRRFFKIADERKENVRKNLESLQGKYQMRLNSLRHLETQVGSLMNLFEIARDFSECMDFETLAEFLLKKLKSELAFQTMRIFLILKPGQEDEAVRVKIYEMLPEGIQEEERELAAQERADFNAMKNTKTMLRRDNGWSFPILEGNEMIAVFSIHGIQEEDLARVEVLSAYLVLLIKKIKLYETVRELSIIDELTQVFVRHHFMERLEEELKRSLRFKLPLTVLMLDIDHFKRYNDDFGHLVGDATLKEVADLLKRNLRRVDLVGRYGGEEFVVAMPETRVANAVEVAERIRSNIARYDFQLYNVKTRVTVSQGLIVFDGEAAAQLENVNVKNLAVELIQKADQAMYRAKEEGRNRVCLYKEAKKS